MAIKQLGGRLLRESMLLVFSEPDCLDAAIYELKL